MEEVVKTRLKLISESVISFTVSGQDALLQLEQNKITIEEIRIIAAKLKSINERFVTETYKYYELVKQPSAADVSEYTSQQMQAEEIVAEMTAKIQGEQNKNRTAQTSENLNVTSKLPRMESAKFDGNVLKWFQFWDQFSSNVDCRNISDVDKLLYLRSVLEGEAKQAVDGLDTTSKNYHIAIETLKERYGKPSAIVDAHYVALYRVRTADKTVRECRNVLDEIERHLRVLKSLGEDVNHNHLRVMIMEKFPEELIYELRMKMVSEEESIENIRKHLEHIISAKEASNRFKREMNIAVKPSSSNSNNESFTLEAFHVSTESKGFGRPHKSRASTTTGKNDKTNRFEYNGSSKRNQFDQRKRYFKDNHKNQCEPRTKKGKFNCIFCEKNHYNDECTTVRTIQERKLRLKNRCFNCLAKGHKSNECRSKRKCRHCDIYGDHNRALCPKIEEKSRQTSNLHINGNIEETILQTSVVRIQRVEEDNNEVNCRALLDCGSQRSYILAKLAKELKLPVVEESCLTVFTFGAQHPQEIESQVVYFRFRTLTNKHKVIYANVVPHITHSIQCPNKTVGNMNIKLNMKRDKMIMADDGSRNDQIDLLIGNDYYHSFMSSEKMEIMKGLFLINSDFGWIWSGKCITPHKNVDQLSVVTYVQNNDENRTKFNTPDLPLRNDNLKILWDLESIGITDSPKTTRDDEAVKQFNETIKLSDNRYYVTWPWIEYPPLLPINFGLAFGRLKNLVRRLEKNTLTGYEKVLKEQLEKGIIEILEDNTRSPDHPVHYLPHHCVLQDNKKTKLRIVYDASAKIKEQKSLNECLYRGPLMLEDLTGLLIRFREKRIGITADVEKAFLQIGLQENDRDVTRFLWLKDVQKEVSPENILHLRFCRVPFGVISSPFLLNATIRYHLTKSNKLINKQIADDIYVDNLVTGTQTVLDATLLYKTCRKSFDQLSMNLRDWNSNSAEFINHIPEIYRAKITDEKVLGIGWNLETDQLYLNIDIKISENTRTKREILRVIASVYDPCGFAVPIILPAKLFLQDLWKQKFKWDTPLSEELIIKWQAIAASLSNIKNIRIPRFYGNELAKLFENRFDEIEWELHCFTDASKLAYSAVIYLRSSFKNKTSLSFVIGKSRLVPIKDQDNLQIPRLELLGALIGSRLISYAQNSLRLKIEKQFLWTDSQIVISWCNSDKLLPPFVARRVNEIKKNKMLYIRFITTDMNPADVATRPNYVKTDNSQWLSGPNFLLNVQSKWPGNAVQKVNTVEIQTQIHNSSSGEDLTSTQLDSPINNDLEARVCNDTEVGKHVEETQEKQTLKQLQKQYFPKEVDGTDTDLKRTLRLIKDNDGLLRCKGRLQNARWLEKEEHPVLLPKNAEFTFKVIEKIHIENFHVGASHTLALVRTKYWIPQGRSQVQKVIKKCIRCRKYGGGPYKLPEMSPLPVERINYSAPFTYTGLDYFGPLTVKNSSSKKRWICLFTCLAIRAVHLEVVKDLSAEECLSALRRFISTRGLPQCITSDNAAQFKLTSDILTSNYCIENKIKWKFIPERAPWFGGFYERLIGLVKHCLRRTVDKHLLNDTQLCTVIKEVEAVINSRPLTTVGEELEHILKPADFLHVGGPLLTETSDKEFIQQATITKTNLIEGWKRGQTILDEFVKMFTNQYLTSLLNRKNIHKQPRITVEAVPKERDIVQIKSDLNRVHWKVGKIVSVTVGPDGHVRVAKVKLPAGETLTRSIAHLYPLEIEEPIVRDAIHPVQNETQVTSTENRPAPTRPERAAAQRAKERIKELTAQLFNNIYMNESL